MRTRSFAMNKLSYKNVDRATRNARTAHGRRKTKWRPGLESLEIRLAPAVFAVNTTLDTVAANLITGKDAMGHISLRSAIMAANAQPGADTIMLPSGTFGLTIPGRFENAGAKGDLDINGDLTIRGQGHTATIIDGNGLDRVLDIHGGTVSISRLTIQDGSNTQGGGLLNEGGTVTLSSVFVQSNAAFGADGAAGANGVAGVSAPQNGHNGAGALGGGIYNKSGSLSLANSTVADNAAIGGDGGRGGDGVAGKGADGVPSTDVHVRDGQNAGGILGGAFVGSGARGGNGGSALGGGIFNASGATLTLIGATISGNLALGGKGGAGGNGGEGDGGRGANALDYGIETEGYGGNGYGGAGGAGGTGGSGEGGGIYNAGHVIVTGASSAFNDNAAEGSAGGGGGSGGAGVGGRGGDGSTPAGGASAGGVGGLGVSGSPGTGGAGATGAGGGVYNASGAVLTSLSQVAFQRNVAGGGSGGSGGAGFVGIGGEGGNGKVALGGGSGIGTAGGNGGRGGSALGAGLFNNVNATATFTAPATNSTTQSVALFASNAAIAGQGGDGGIGAVGLGGFGGNGFYGAVDSPSQGGRGGGADGGAGGDGATGGLAAGGGFYNAGNMSFTAITLNVISGEAIDGGNGAGGNGGDAGGGLGGNGGHGGNGGNSASGNGGNAGNDGNARGGGGFNAATGTLFIDPRQGAFAGSAQSRATSLIRLNKVGPGIPKPSGIAGTAVPGAGGQLGGQAGNARNGVPGMPGLLGQDRGGGLYLTAGGKVTLRNINVSMNQAATGDPDIFGTFSK
jgi:hypothetical protein